jgi:MerC mercury resistance protein
MEEKILVVERPFWLDSLGMTVSFACAIQCSLFPLLTGVLPLLGLGFLAGPEMERILLMISVVLASGGFYFGFRYHNRYYIFMFLIAGLALICTGRISLDGNLELPFVVSGTLLLASGHVLNRRLCLLCRGCPAHKPVVKSELY